MKNESFFVSCPKGLEIVLEQELQTLDISKRTIRPGGCYFTASPLEAIKVILESRIASRVYRRLSKFHIRSGKELHKKAMNYSWNQVMSFNQTFKISTLFDRKAKDYFKNSQAISLILKDAICDFFREQQGSRPNVDIKHPDHKFLLRLEEEESGFKAIILSDLCGASLSNRGYRTKGHTAPLRENLAAGIIALTNWNPQNEIFIDSMCGSGTFLIEAAMIKNQLPPSQLRIRHYIEKKQAPWDFLNHKWIDRTKVQELLLQYYNNIISKFNDLQNCTIYGYDNQYNSIKVAMNNLNSAYLPAKLVHIEKGDALTLNPPKEKKGIVICNPPYGKRLTTELEELYYNYGENLKKKFGGFRAYVFTGNLPLRKKISLQTSARIPLHNGDIECRLLKYDLY